MHVEVLREASDTRPLSLKNTDNKILAATINHAIIVPIAAATHHSQRGIVPRGQLLQNVVDRDTEAHHAGMIAHDANASHDPRAHHDPPILDNRCLLAIQDLFDFAATFPSIARAWIASMQGWESVC